MYPPSQVPDGRLDERSLHGGCRPRGEGVEKWGANQWIWNHPRRMGRFDAVPERKGRAGARAKGGTGKAGCDDAGGANCAAWADAGECDNNPAYMHKECAASCGKC